MVFWSDAGRGEDIAAQSVVGSQLPGSLQMYLVAYVSEMQQSFISHALCLLGLTGISENLMVGIDAPSSQFCFPPH